MATTNATIKLLPVIKAVLEFIYEFFFEINLFNKIVVWGLKIGEACNISRKLIIDLISVFRFPCIPGIRSP